MRLSLPLAAVLGLACSFGVAADNSDGPDLEAIRAQQVQLREQALTGDDLFAHMSDVERSELVARQDELLRLLAGKQSINELDHEEKVAAFNTLEWISATLSDSEADRLICENATATGSHRRIRQCQTVAERRAARERMTQIINSSGFRNRWGKLPQAGEILVTP